MSEPQIISANLSDKGLTSQQVTSRRDKYGLNQLPEQPPPSNWSIFLAQLKNPLVYVLLCAGVVTSLLGHLSDTVIILLAVFINTILGFIQEKKANQAFSALKQFVTTTSEVIRNGKRQRVATAELVPGDLVVLSQGTKIPADGELLFVNRAYFDEAIMTGESSPIAKEKGEAVFMGTTVTVGRALYKVTATGSATKIGSIAQQIQQIEVDTPLKKQLTLFSKKLVIIVLALTSLVFVIGLIRGNPLVDMLTTAIALAVSSIPEGLVVSMTVVLAVGMQRILKRRGLVKKLSSAETLGSVTAICIDKTGTLTLGKMQVVETAGTKRALALQALLANDLDDPLVLAAYDWAENIRSPEKLSTFTRLDSIPFTPQARFFMSLHRWNKDSNMLFVNGAPDTLLPWTNLRANDKALVAHRIEELTSQGRRVLGMARKKVALDHKNLKPSDATEQLEWVGLLAFFDPVRESVSSNLKLAQQAGIKIFVITGDYAKTSEFVMKEIGIPVTEKSTLTGEELEHFSEKQLIEKLGEINLFARTTPDQKHKIVAALQKNNQVVAMMGDGVNDAPAIHQADIGIAVSEASDVARESADLILLDSNFATIISAVEEGRGIFDNIRKITLYLLSDAFAEILLLLGSILLNLPLPVTAVQIIWVNLVSDGFPGLSLTIDDKRPGIMKEKPRFPDEKLVNKWMIELIATVSVFAGGVALLVFYVTYTATQNLAIAQSMTFATLGLDSLVYVFSVRSLLEPFWKVNPFTNKWLVVSVLAGIGLQILPFLTPSTREFFRVVELDFRYWLVAGFIAICVFLAVEVFKSVWNKSHKGLY